MELILLSKAARKWMEWVDLGVRYQPIGITILMVCWCTGFGLWEVYSILAHHRWPCLHWLGLFVQGACGSWWYMILWGKYKTKKED